MSLAYTYGHTRASLLENNLPVSRDYLSNLHEHLKADSTVVEQSQIKGKAEGDEAQLKVHD